MIDMAPSNNIELLNTFLGKTIASVRRQIFTADMDLVDYEQMADGPVELKFDDDTVVHFIAETEAFSVGVCVGDMPRYGDGYLAIDVSRNNFWSERINQVIDGIKIFKVADASDDYLGEFGVGICLRNGKMVLVEFVDTEECPDRIRVTAQYEGAPCLIQNIGKEVLGN